MRCVPPAQQRRPPAPVTVSTLSTVPMIVVSVLTSYIGEAPPIPACAITIETAATVSMVDIPRIDNRLSEAMMNFLPSGHDRQAGGLASPHRVLVTGVPGA